MSHGRFPLLSIGSFVSILSRAEEVKLRFTYIPAFLISEDSDFIFCFVFCEARKKSDTTNKARHRVHPRWPTFFRREKMDTGV